MAFNIKSAQTPGLAWKVSAPLAEQIPLVILTAKTTGLAQF